MFNNIVLIQKDGLDEKSQEVNKIKDIFKNSSIKTLNFSELDKSHLNDKGLVLTIGGDGTFIKAANLIEDQPILGINASPLTSEGALTTINLNNLKSLKKLLKKEFELTKKTRIKVTLNNKILGEHALNEVYVGTRNQFHSSRYKLIFKNKEEEQRSAGIIISTSTGSPAWFRSAGGKPFQEDEKIAFIVREPYFGKRIFIPSILQGEIYQNEELLIESTRHSGGALAIGENIYDLEYGDLIKIEISDKPLHVIELNETKK